MGNTGSFDEMHGNSQWDLATYYRNSRVRSGYTERGVAIKKYQQENLSSAISGCDTEIVSNKFGEWVKSFPRSKIGYTANFNGNVSPLPHLKVLPHINESLKLRTTSNGTILQSGGTISGRREQQQQTVTNLENSRLHNPGLMQRSRTLIYERGVKYQNDFMPNIEKKQSGHSVLRRAQTQFELNYKGLPQQDFNKNQTQSLAAVSTITSSALDLRKDAAENQVIAINNVSIDVPSAIKKGNKNAKVNKYNKKRKAPAAPSSLLTNTKVHNEPSSNGRQQNVIVDINNNSSNSRTTKNNTQTTTSKAPSASSIAPTAAYSSLGKSRIFLTKAETDSNIAEQRNFLAQGKSIVPVVPQLPYRREKSFDSTLLSARTPSIVAESQQQRIVAATLQHHTRQKEKKEATKIPQLRRTFFFGMDTRRSANAEKEAVKGAQPTSGNQVKLHIAGDKQQTHSDTEKSAGLYKLADKTTSNNSAGSIMTTEVYDITVSPKQYDDDTDNNGLQVHVRPTLPRRHLNIPRFSPAAAWRMLTDEQQNLQLQRHSFTTAATTGKKQQMHCPTSVATNEAFSNNECVSNIEEPIQPVCKTSKSFAHKNIPQDVGSLTIGNGGTKKLMAKAYATQWTPQQDLEDDDDDDNSSDELHTKSNTNDETSIFLVGSSSNIESSTTPRKGDSKTQNGSGAASAHVFSFSLPRDGVFGNGFCDNKTTNEKKSGFSSLQKLKRTVSGGNCGCIQTKYGDQVMEQMLSIGTSYQTDNNDAISKTLDTTHESTVNKNVQESLFSNGYRSDNWVLGKMKFDVSKRDILNAAAVANANLTPEADTNKSMNQGWNTLVSKEPLSLSYLTAGKHVMYLPGHTNNFIDHTTSNKITEMEYATHEHKEFEIKQNQNKKSRKRELHIRQSLQDPIPLRVSTLGNIYTAKRDTSAERSSLQKEKQRFSFQSTVRLLEKRRLAEKLSKEAEIKEAQRRSELEAMKRVEEDFQRKRASEKASIRQQLRLVSNLESFDPFDQYQSLPTKSDELLIKRKHLHDVNVNYFDSHHDDVNNNIKYRADPDGAVSSPSISPTMQNIFAPDNSAFRSISFDFDGISVIAVPEHFQF